MKFDDSPTQGWYCKCGYRIDINGKQWYKNKPLIYDGKEEIKIPQIGKLIIKKWLDKAKNAVILKAKFKKYKNKSAIKNEKKQK